MVDGSIIDAVGHCPKGTFTGSSGCGLELSNSGFFVVFTIFQRARLSRPFLSCVFVN